jgi:REP element-mobilizing transposase RayT
MVRWYHLIISAYGFWLPNDPRGSWSEFVWAWELRKFGPATKTAEKRSLAKDPHDVQVRRAAKCALKYPPVRFNARQRDCIAIGFDEAASAGGYNVFACCVSFDHAHLVIERHERTIEKIAGHLKAKASMALDRAGVHPLAVHRTPAGRAPSPWSEGCWSVFIRDVDQLRAAIRYVERHPEKEQLPFVVYPFVQLFA